MSNSTLITDYLGRGTHSARPATPPIPAGGTALYYETDTTTLFYWNGAAWVSAGGGLSAGTPPTIVQSGISTAASASITLGGAPANGNLLVAVTANPTTSTAGAGWTIQETDQGGTDFVNIVTKVAGAGESATQSPIGSAPTNALICMWELNGQAASFLLNAVVDAQDARAGTHLTGRSKALGIPTNALFLGAVCIAGTAQTISKTSNVTVDQTANAGTTRNGVMGHANASVPVGQIEVVFSATAGHKTAGITITA